MCIRDSFKMAAAAILDFSNFKFLTVGRLKRGELRRHAKFGRNRLKRPRYGDFSIFQDGGRRHLGFFKFQIFNGWTAEEGRSASVYQIWLKSVKTKLRYRDFSIFQDGGRRHLGFFKFQIFNGRTAEEGRTALPCQICSKSVKPRFFDFFKMAAPPPSWIFQISNF